jgi:hypothetical protein
LKVSIYPKRGRHSGFIHRSNSESGAGSTGNGC